MSHCCGGSVDYVFQKIMASPSSPRLTGKEALTQFPLLGPATTSAHGKVHLKQCDLLRLSRKQKRLCRREPGLAETLRDAIRLGVVECQYQFRNERWNCSLDGRADLLKRGRCTSWYTLENSASPHCWLLPRITEQSYRCRSVNATSLVPMREH